MSENEKTELRKEFTIKEYDGGKFPAIKCSVFQCDLQQEIERLSELGASDTEIVELIRNAPAEIGYISSGGKISFDAPYGKFPLTEKDVETLKGMRTNKPRKTGAVLAGEIKIPRKGESFIGYKMRVISALGLENWNEDEGKTLYQLSLEIAE